ncbi:MAG: hypothetical protein ABJC13_20830 [Acidobacteriota bacterium]
MIVKEILVFYVRLAEIAPPIWRRLEIRADGTFWHLHCAIQRDRRADKRQREWGGRALRGAVPSSGWGGGDTSPQGKRRRVGALPRNP